MSDIEARIRAALDDVHIESGRKDEHEAVVQRVLQAARQAPASGEVEPVGYLTVEHFRDDPNMQNIDYEHIGAVMKPGRHRVFTHPPAKVPDVTEFGKGELVVSRGAYGKKPAVFVSPVQNGPGVVGEHPGDREPNCDPYLRPGEWVMTFPTHEQAGWVCEALWNRLTTPTPATTPETEWVKLPHDVVINGGMTFRKGVKLSTFIKAAERWHREAMKQYAGISKEEIQALMHRPPTAQEQ